MATQQWLWEMVTTQWHGRPLKVAVALPRRQRQKMSDEGIGVDVMRQEGRPTCWDKQLDNQLL
jgi:hypothetical protein